MAEAVIKFDNYKNKRPRIGLLGVDPSAKMPFTVSNILYAAVVDTAGSELPQEGVSWYCDSKLLGKGNKIDLRVLANGRHTIRLIYRGETYVSAKSWIIERTNKGFTLLHEICDPVPAPTEPPHEHPHPKPSNPCND